MLYTNNCSELTKNDVDKEVVLCGWVHKIRNFGKFAFVDLRDRYGITQLSLTGEQYSASNLKNEDCIRVKGKVVIRQDPNPNIPTGQIEIKVSDIEVFSHSQLTPFIIDDKTDALEDTRLKSRYLDLRRPCLQKNLAIRHKMLKAARDYLESESFLEIETPTLVKSTPEGARDYLVPSRVKKGCFYALPQSPQIYKQLLMISGLEKYYQVARCYRDEDQRADRQPEFTQIDVEMSFCQREDVLNVIESLLKKIFKDSISYSLPDFERISYKDAIASYGSDKPDMRFDMLLKDLYPILSKSEFASFKQGYVKGFVVSDGAKLASRKVQDKDNELLKKYNLKGIYIKVENSSLTGSIVKFFSEDLQREIISSLDLKEGDLLIVANSNNYERLSLGLGALRIEYAKKLNLLSQDCFKPCFVLDWPMFEKKEDGTYESLSNPFTRPRDEDVYLLDSEPEKVLSYAYDTVINGLELSSGSLRIYSGEMQKKVFDLLGLSQEDIKKRFGFFVDAFNYGTPPHGGFALGVDRIAMLLCKTDNVRDVIAFPKNLSATDMMAECPSQVPQESLDILGLKIVGDDHGNEI